MRPSAAASRNGPRLPCIACLRDQFAHLRGVAGMQRDDRARVEAGHGVERRRRRAAARARPARDQVREQARGDRRRRRRRRAMRSATRAIPARSSGSSSTSRAIARASALRSLNASTDAATRRSSVSPREHLARQPVQPFARFGELALTCSAPTAIAPRRPGPALRRRRPARASRPRGNVRARRYQCDARACSSACSAARQLLEPAEQEVARQRMQPDPVRALAGDHDRRLARPVGRSCARASACSR